MIKHIVMFRLKEQTPNGRNTDLMKLKNILDDLKKKISEIQYLQTGLNISTRPVAFDLVLTTEFFTQGDLNTYINHPEHKKVVEFLKLVNKETAVVDYEF